MARIISLDKQFGFPKKGKKFWSSHILPLLKKLYFIIKLVKSAVEILHLFKLL